MGLSSHLRLDTERIRDGAVVSVWGDVDLTTFGAAKSALDAARGGATVLILDLREVGFMDTSGLRLVIEEQRRAAEGGYRFAVVRGSGRVQRLFEIAGLAGDEACCSSTRRPSSTGGGRG